MRKGFIWLSHVLRVNAQVLSTLPWFYAKAQGCAASTRAEGCSLLLGMSCIACEGSERAVSLLTAMNCPPDHSTLVAMGSNTSKRLRRFQLLLSLQVSVTCG